ncbi:RICIN domain-containing protein [Streptacidiphilus sp. EB129]|uniref:RICIN domain-containing protein n=1 Tax=Streptacidiphilus sp. EB129 TaxID=3156262 RepID=UPI0035162C48
MKVRPRIAKAAGALAAALGLMLAVPGSASASTILADTNILQNGWSGLCLAVNEGVMTPGNTVVEYGCLGTNYPDQYWGFSQSQSHNGYYYIYNQKDNNYCLTFQPGQADQVALTISWCGYQGNNGSTNQLWAEDTYFYGGGYSYPLYQAYGDGRCMSVPGNNQQDWATLDLYYCGGYPDQRWYWGGYN